MKLEDRIAKFEYIFFTKLSDYRKQNLLNKKDIEIIGINRISILKMEKYYELKREYPTSIAGEYENLLNKLHCIIDGMKLNRHIDFIPIIKFINKGENENCQ